VTRPAEILVVDRHGVFIADEAEIDGGWLHAEGRWRTRGGPNNERLTYSERRSYTFACHTVRRIRWTP